MYTSYCDIKCGVFRIIECFNSQGTDVVILGKKFIEPRWFCRLWSLVSFRHLLA